jgi:hypothetical protein
LPILRRAVGEAVCGGDPAPCAAGLCHAHGGGGGGGCRGNP